MAIEAEAIEGLEDDLAGEIRECVPATTPPLMSGKRRVTLTIKPHDINSLNGLRTALSAYVVIHHRGQRPSALLADAQLGDACRLIVASSKSPYASFSIDAPGRESKAVVQVRDAIAEAAGVRYDPELGEMLVRIRRVTDGWEALVRTTPRPLSTRRWRVEAVPGAVNAAIAACMIRRTRPTAQDSFINLMSGSGTIAVERALAEPARHIIGIDNDRDMLRSATLNAGAAEVSQATRFLPMDAFRTAFTSQTFDKLAVVLPYGFRVGSHTENVVGYPAFLEEAARLAWPGGLLVLLTQEVGLLEHAIASSGWSIEDQTRIWQGGHRPVLCTLSRRDD